jgi:probable HAF family extracellular repeat protein
VDRDTGRELPSGGSLFFVFQLLIQHRVIAEVRMNISRTVQRTLLIGIVVCGARIAFASAQFVGLGSLDGDSGSRAMGVSPDGQFVTGYGYNGSTEEAFRWSEGTGMVGLGFLSGVPSLQRSFGHAVSNGGFYVVGQSILPVQAFRWYYTGSMTGMGDLSGGHFESGAYDISPIGDVIVGYGVSDSGTEAFRWTPSTGMVGLGDLPSGRFHSEANATSADGSVIVGKGTTAAYDDVEAFRWTEAEGMIRLGELPGGGPYSEATDVSADGVTAVGWAWSTNDSLEAFRWTEESGMVGLGRLPGQPRRDTLASAVSGDSSRIVGHVDVSGPDIAFIWDEDHGMRELKQVLEDHYGLDLTGWTLREATGISYDGNTIVGYGSSPSGNVEAFIAVLPEPYSIWILAFGILALGAFKQRLQRTGG